AMRGAGNRFGRGMRHAVLARQKARQFRRHAGTCSIDGGYLSVPFICRDPRLISGLARIRILPMPWGLSVSLPLRRVAAGVLIGVAAAPLGGGAPARSP